MAIFIREILGSLTPALQEKQPGQEKGCSSSKCQREARCFLTEEEPEASLGASVMAVWLCSCIMASGSPFCALLLMLLAFTLEEETWAEAPLTGGPKLPGPGQQRFPDAQGRNQGRGGGFILSGEGSPHTSRGTQLTTVHEPPDKTKPAWLHTPCLPDPCGQPPYCQTWLVKVTLLAVLGLLVMGGNGLAIAVLASSVSGWSHSSRFMLLSLAASDAALAVLVVPLNLYQSLELGPAAPKEAAREEAVYCRVVAFINSSLFGASLYSLAGVSLERYVAVFFPLHYCRLLSPRRVLLLIVTAWLLPALLLVPLAIPAPVAVLHVRFSAAALLCEPDYSSNPFYSLWMAGTIFCPAAATIAFTNMRLWLVARSQRQRGKDVGMLGKAGRPKRLRMLQLDAAARVLLPVVFAFFVCWAPCIGTIVYNSITQERVPDWLEFVALWLPIGSGFLNCFVYFWVNRNFRHKVQKVGQKHCLTCCLTEQDLRPQPLHSISAQVRMDCEPPGLSPGGSLGVSPSSNGLPLSQHG
ncbi:probable G-protein coupled receptor 21 [Ahaetulla prasina]|uniref:probable G-protein coupled receptor 21 n=1 Tax=Ahaetulla prasina TaxID=499056 RepID=UPI002649BE0D|nr:probable G-protein coupled receptor 21 [Ahaetulla prasina]